MRKKIYNECPITYERTCKTDQRAVLASLKKPVDITIHLRRTIFRTHQGVGKGGCALILPPPPISKWKN